MKPFIVVVVVVTTMNCVLLVLCGFDYLRYRLICLLYTSSFFYEHEYAAGTPHFWPN